MDKSKLITLEKPLARAISAIRNYDAILWAGSGLSLYAGYPLVTQLNKRIIDSAKTKKDKEILINYENSLMDLSNEYCQLYSRDRLINLFKTIFDAKPSVDPFVHKVISNIPQINTIITTNYDHLFEIAYENNITVCTETAFNKTLRDKVDLYKIHGDTSDSKSIVITSKDYSQFYDRLDTVMWNKIKGLLAEKSVIFVGYSLEDKNIQDVFEKIIMQLNNLDKELFIVTPTMQDYKLKHLNTICKTTHIPLKGEEFFEYIEAEIKKNIVIDAVHKKISIDEAYKICRENGITPTIVNEPNGNTTKLVVDKISLSPENFFDHMVIPFGRGANFASNPETYKAFTDFINDCDCKELILPAEDAILYQNINGIHIPENNKINGQFAEIVKIEKQEMIEYLSLVLGEDNKLGCNVCIRGFHGNVRSRISIELSSLVISSVKESSTTSYNFSFKYPHSTNDAISDLARLKLWCDGTDLVFERSNKDRVYALDGILDKEKISDLISFIDENLKLYDEIQTVECDLDDEFMLDKELTTDDIMHIRSASSSLFPKRIKYTETFSYNAGKLTLDELDFYCNSVIAPIMQMTYSDVLPEDCFQLFDKNIVLGIRKIKIIEPYIKNIDEAKRASEENLDVLLEFASKKEEGILEYMSPQFDS